MTLNPTKDLTFWIEAGDVVYADKYIISGSDFFIEKNIKKIVEGCKDPELLVVYGDEFSKDAFFTFIYSISLFSEVKIVIVKNSDKIKDIKTILDNALKAQNAIQIFAFGEVKDQLIQNYSKKYKLNVIQEAKKSRGQYINEIIKMYAEKDFEVDYEYAREIYDCCDKNLNNVINELEKISLYFLYEPNKKNIDISSFFTGEKDNMFFRFIDSYCGRQKKESMTVLHNIVHKRENIRGLFYLFFRRIKQIYLYKISPTLVSAHSFVLNKIKKESNLWSNKELDDIIECFSSIDYLAKTSSYDLTSGLYKLLSFI